VFPSGLSPGSGSWPCAQSELTQSELTQSELTQRQLIQSQPIQSQPIQSQPIQTAEPILEGSWPAGGVLGRDVLCKGAGGIGLGCSTGADDFGVGGFGDRSSRSVRRYLSVV
jgi:hypothetical protein